MTSKPALPSRCVRNACVNLISSRRTFGKIKPRRQPQQFEYLAAATELVSSSTLLPFYFLPLFRSLHCRLSGRPFQIPINVHRTSRTMLLADDRNRVCCRRIGGHGVGKEFYRLPPAAAISFAMDLDRYVIVGARRSDRLGRGVRAYAVKVPGIVSIKAATP